MGNISHILETMIQSDTISNITIIGQHNAFFRWSSQTCKFEWAENQVTYVSATFINRTMLTCETPAIPAGLLTVSVSNTNTTFGTAATIRANGNDRNECNQWLTCF